MDIYRRIASIRDDEDASDMLDELIDRFGEPPKAVTNLVDIALLRAAAQALDIFEITQKQNYVLFKFETPDVEKISRICSSRAYRNRLSLNAGASPYLALKLAQGENPLVAAREFIRDFSAVPETKAVPS